MSTNSAALSRLIEQVRAGSDALLTGSPGETRQLLAQAAGCLSPDFRVVEVTGEAAGLSLSRLMAQLSGRGDLDAQDDAVLELGFRRLAVPDAPGQRTVLLLNAGHGIQRSALRFLQHVGRGAPALVMVVAGGAELEALLSEPGFAALRTRLTPAPPVELPVEPVMPAPSPPPAPPPSTALALTAVRLVPAVESPPARGRVRIWAWSGVGMAASLALGAWLGHASGPAWPGHAAGPAWPGHAAGPQASPAPSAASRALLATAIEPAVAPPPTPATPPTIALAAPVPHDPAMARSLDPIPAEASAATPARDHGPEPLPARPPGLSTLANAEPAAVPPVEQPVRASGPVSAELDPPHAPLAKRPEPRPKESSLARTAERHTRVPRPPTREFARELEREPEAARYDWESQGPPAGYTPPRWGAPRYDPPDEGPYLGTYAAGPSGMRTFRYER